MYLFRINGPSYVHVVRDDCLHCLEQNFIVRVILDGGGVQNFNDVATTCSSISQACTIEPQDYMVFSLNYWPVPWMNEFVHGLITVNKRFSFYALGNVRIRMMRWLSVIYACAGS